MMRLFPGIWNLRPVNNQPRQPILALGNSGSGVSPLFLTERRQPGLLIRSFQEHEYGLFWSGRILKDFTRLEDPKK